jgi:hypothetical protein
MERAQPGVNDCARFSLANHKGLGARYHVNDVTLRQFRLANLYVGGRCRAELLQPDRVSHTDGRAAPKCPAVWGGR